MQIFRDLLNGDLLKCVDVGARGGMQKHWLPFQQVLALDAIEPDHVACKAQADAKRPNETWFSIGLGGKTGTAKLYLLSKPSGSSLFPPHPENMSDYSGESYGTVAREVPIELMTFSDFIREHKRPPPNLVKLDTQGSELDILESLEPAHRAELLGIQTEVEFIEMYKGQPLFDKLDARMRKQGFVLYDFLPVRQTRFKDDKEFYFLKKHLGIAKNRSDMSARMLAGDALYIKSPDEVLNRCNRIECAKLLMILLMYRFYDEALWFIEESGSRGIFTNLEVPSLIACVKKLAPRPALHQRDGTVGRMAHIVTKLLRFGKTRVFDYWLLRKWDYK
jgi:FkbM family methyltransferase